MIHHGFGALKAFYNLCLFRDGSGRNANEYTTRSPTFSSQEVGIVIDFCRSPTRAPSQYFGDWMYHPDNTIRTINVRNLENNKNGRSSFRGYCLATTGSGRVIAERCTGNEEQQWHFTGVGQFRHMTRDGQCVEVQESSDLPEPWLEDCNNDETQQWAFGLSLIHISEPTRPY